MSAASAPSRTALRPINVAGQRADPGRRPRRAKSPTIPVARNSVLVTELLNNIGSKAAGAEALFSKTRIAISRASNGEQVPAVSSSLLEDVHLAADVAAEKAGG